MDVLFQTAQSLENSRTLEMFSRSENHCVCSNGSITADLGLSHRDEELSLLKVN